MSVCLCVAAQIEGDAVDRSLCRTRIHKIHRLRRAVERATHLEHLCAAVASRRTAIEAEAYTAWMVAQLHLELEEWSTALTVSALRPVGIACVDVFPVLALVVCHANPFLWVSFLVCAALLLCPHPCDHS